MENVGIFYDHLEYNTGICITYSWPFVIVCGHLVYFSQFGIIGPNKNLATLLGKMRCDKG
jgi:hypothetical protein